MGLALELRTSQGIRTFALDPSELEVLASLVHKSAELGEAISVLFGPEHLGDVRQIPRTRLSDAIRVIAQGVSQAPTTLYELRVQLLPGTWSSASGASGLRIDGQLYKVDTGPDRCILSKIAIDESGRGYTVSRTDIRNRRTIMTENQGEIRIHKRRRALKLVKILRDIDREIQALRDGVVSVTVG